MKRPQTRRGARPCAPTGWFQDPVYGRGEGPIGYPAVLEGPSTTTHNDVGAHGRAPLQGRDHDQVYGRGGRPAQGHPGQGIWQAIG
jgi:hypothetical protein